VTGQFEFIIKEIKNVSECIIELFKHVVIFRTRQKCIEKHEAQPSASSTSLVFLKNHHVLI